MDKLPFDRRAEAWRMVRDFFLALRLSLGIFVRYELESPRQMGQDIRIRWRWLAIWQAKFLHLRLPRHYGPVKVEVWAYCRGGRGEKWLVYRRISPPHITDENDIVERYSRGELFMDVFWASHKERLDRWRKYGQYAVRPPVQG